MENQEDQFVTKKIEQPILGAQVKDQIKQQPEIYTSEQNGFYSANKYYIWAICAGILIIVLLGFFAFKKPVQPTVKEALVDVSIKAPEKIPSGGDAGFVIDVKNNDNQKLTQVRVELAYPEGVTYKSSVPPAQNLSGTVFAVNDLISGQNVSVMVRTKTSGNVGDQKQIIARMFYHYNNFNSEFVKEKAITFNLSASDVALELSGPQTVSNAQLVSYTIKYKNNSDQAVTNARVKANFPDAFSVAQSEPIVSLGNNIWELNTLNPGDEGQIQIQGTFKSANPGESKTWTAEFLVLGSAGDYNSQSTAQITTAISSLPLLVSQEVSNNSSQALEVVKPGDLVQFNISYQNNSSVAANGVNVIVTLNSKALDLSSIQAEGGQVNNNTIIWSAAGVPNLEILNPSESGALHFSVKVKNPASKDSSTNLSVVSEIKIKSNEYQTFLPGNSVSLKISSPMTLSSALSFVSGQLPPKVGQSTVYKVKFALTNSTNDYEGGVLTAFLPLGLVNFDAQSVTPAESQKVTYDPATGKLTWNMGILPANSGKFSAAKILEFNIRINPSQSLSGQSPILVKTINFLAKDSFTLEKIESTASNITTQNIEGGYGNGQVGQ